jgi:6-phosphogluconolactonase
MTTLSVRRFATRAALDAAVTERLSGAIAAQGPTAVMLSGGTTPLPAYRALSNAALPHDAGLRIVFTDERYVPDDSGASNYHQTRPLLDAMALAPGAIVRVRTELPLEEAAADYDRGLAALLAAGIPINLGLLGLGADGHTASLFGTGDLERGAKRLAIPVNRPDGLLAVSVTPRLLAHVADPIFLVAGDGKREAIKALVAQDPGLIAWRAVQGCERVQLWVA